MKTQISTNPKMTKQRVVLGNKLENPYSLKNLRKAQRALYNQAKKLMAIREEMDSYFLQPLELTALYVRFFPKDTVKMITLSQYGLSANFYGYPLDYEVIEEGNRYHDPSIPADKISWIYGVVKPSKKYYPSGTIHVYNTETKNYTNKRLGSTYYNSTLEDQRPQIPRQLIYDMGWIPYGALYDLYDDTPFEEIQLLDGYNLTGIKEKDEVKNISPRLIYQQLTSEVTTVPLLRDKIVTAAAANTRRRNRSIFGSFFYLPAPDQSEQIIKLFKAYGY